MTKRLPAFRLGKLPPRLDSRTLQLANYPCLAAVAGAPPSSSSGQGTTLSEKCVLAPVPRSVDWTAKIPSWPMFSNDTLGDCTAAAAAHMIQCWTANASDAFTPSDAQVIAAYSATGHYIPDDAATDQGAVELDVLNFWRQQGIAGHKIAAYVSFSPQNFEHTRQAINIFGGIYIGLALPLSAQTQEVWDVPSFVSRVAAFIRRHANSPARAVQNHSCTGTSLFSECGGPFCELRWSPPNSWYRRSMRSSHSEQFCGTPLCDSSSASGTSADSTSISSPESISLNLFRSSGLSSLQPPASSLQNDFTPGSWGGHAVPVLAYDSDTLTCITWGAKKRMTWEFFARYCDESYAPLSPDWLNAQGKTPEGFGLDALQADLAQIADTPKCATLTAGN